MSALRNAVAAFAAFFLCAVVSGCVTPGSTSSLGATAMKSATRLVSSRDVRGAVIPGKSTRINLVDALGSTTVIRFDSGYEVWVYRLTNDETPEVDDSVRSEGKARALAPADTEFVVLLSPAGIVTKTRTRPPPPLREKLP